MTPMAYTWWAVALRGAAALALGVLIAVQTHVMAAQLPLLFGGYVLVDGALATGAVIAVGVCRCGALLLAEALSGVALGLASIYAPYATPFTTPVYMITWALMIGGAEVFAGGQVVGVLDDLRERRFLDRRLRRRALAPSYAYQLAGVFALAFAVALAVGPTFQAASVIVLLGLFAAAFGYLHLCVGLNLGLYVVGQSAI
jgi:uncharacterized membrane protein HdeD (DUF308 family)